MSNRNNRVLHILVILALIVAPLRGLLAMPAADDMSQMQHATLSPVAMAEAASMDADGAMSDCEHCCDTSSCEQSCYSCVHLSPTIPGSAFLTHNLQQSRVVTATFSSLAEHAVLPLLQPPISSLN